MPSDRTDTLTAPAQPQPAAGAFVFLDHGPLIDGELQLVQPSLRWLDDILASAHHPLSLELDPRLAELERGDLLDILATAPGGHVLPDPAAGKVPAYLFWMRLLPGILPESRMLPVPFAGHLSLRIGDMPDLKLYYGHIGYTVYGPARGQHYAERACRLVLPLARAHGISPLWITTDPDNAPSRRTCQRLGARLVETLDVPPDHPLHLRGQRQKCRYRLDL